MATAKLDKAAWQKTFDQMSKTQLVGKQVEIEVTALDIGDQIWQEWIQLLGITYDLKGDLIEIFVSPAKPEHGRQMMVRRERAAEFPAVGIDFVQNCSAVTGRPNR